MEGFDVATAAAAATAVGRVARAAAPPATNRLPRLVAARSDYRHKTANLPTNDCFSVDHVIRFQASRLLGCAAQSPRTITARKTSLRPADGRRGALEGRPLLTVGP